MIKTFRKEQGGYALAYVMIVILVIMSVVMIVCTTAMKNYEAQQDSVKRMADKYAAEGEIEKVLLVEIRNELIGIEAGTKADTKNSAAERCKIYLEKEETPDLNRVTIEETVGDVTVAATVKLDLTITEVPNDPETLIEEPGKWQVTDVSVDLLAYDVYAKEIGGAA